MIMKIKAKTPKNNQNNISYLNRSLLKLKNKIRFILKKIKSYR